jgi:hypothetical protein
LEACNAGDLEALQRRRGEAVFDYLVRQRDGRLTEWRLCRDTQEALAHARADP